MLLAILRDSVQKASGKTQQSRRFRRPGIPPRRVIQEADYYLTRPSRSHMRCAAELQGSQVLPTFCKADDLTAFAFEHHRNAAQNLGQLGIWCLIFRHGLPGDPKSSSSQQQPCLLDTSPTQTSTLSPKSVQVTTNGILVAETKRNPMRS